MKISPDQRISCVLHVELVAHGSLIDHLIYNIPVGYVAAPIGLVTILQSCNICTLDKTFFFISLNSLLLIKT